MANETIQVRMNKTLIKQIDTFVKSGMYDNRSEVVRDALRHMFAPRLKPEVLEECDRILAEMEAGEGLSLEEVKKALSKK